MEKLFLKKKKLPRLLIIEGLWKVGKTTFINNILSSESKIISEPIHPKQYKASEQQISQWYYKKHKKNFLEAILLMRKERVILDRSFISTVAYEYAKTGKISKKYEKLVAKLIENNSIVIVFLYSSRKFAELRIKLINDELVKKSFLNKNFYNRYIFFYKKLFPKIIKSKIVSIKVDLKGKFIEPRAIYLQFKKHFSDQKKINEDCASAVLYSGNKILLLHDRKYNHFVFPQGHRRGSEELKSAVAREVREETGFMNLRLIRKLKEYRYYFFRRGQMVCKTVHVFLTEILNKECFKKELESHEKYTNHFYQIDEAIRKVRWPEDKKLLRLSKKYF